MELRPRDVVVDLPEGTAALAGGGKFAGRTELALAPYSILSFSAPEGAVPTIE